MQERMLKNKHDSKRCHKGVFQTTDSCADIFFLFNIQHLYKQSFQIPLLHLQKLSLKVFQFYNRNKKKGIWLVKVYILNFLEILGVTKTLHVSWFASGCLSTKCFDACVTKQKFSSSKPCLGNNTFNKLREKVSHFEAHFDLISYRSQRDMLHKFALLF